ncbi:MAG: carbamoyltransferase HypF, partial [Deltaproteobacteria bacterium]|nr:carbamoyltransferase HypF [Deltaproteobacteria bacterium]
MKEASDKIKARKVSVHGVVQGVGFRPLVYQLALNNHLKGQVFNTSGDVTIILEGAEGDIESFISQLRVAPPPRSRIESIDLEERPVEGLSGFEIKESRIKRDEYQLISPDIATCSLCISEISNPSDRRYKYPFTNCTNCGPRFTIIEDMPYDRGNTTMRNFKMCPACGKEYEDPYDRRFHAQPNACPECGPALQLSDSSGKIIPGDPLSLSIQYLMKSKVVALKGLGGFLLSCDATDDSAVSMLRERKGRGSKPFALMMASLYEVRKYCHVSEKEKDLLLSPQSPIVLLKRRSSSSSISSLVAPNIDTLGVMLPYTPLHHLILRGVNGPLVMTSGNVSEEPIIADNDEALMRLSGIADFFLTHNRDICSRYDDSVAMVVNNRTQVIRRARGLAPYPINLTYDSSMVLACGAEVKNSFCITRGRHAFLSQHIGDMENLETLEHFQDTVKLYKKLFHIAPEVVAYDMHPDYLSTRYALDLIKETGIEGVPVQHHHA